MGSLSIWHILIFGAIALLLFGGRGKVSDLMGDLAKGVTSFRKGLRDSEHEDGAERANPTVAEVPLIVREDERVGR